MSEEPLDLTYRYQFAFKSNISMDELMVTNGRFYDMYYRLGLYIDATNYVIEVGDINE